MIYKIGFVGPNASEEVQGLFAAFPSGVWHGIEEETVKQADPVSGEVREATGYVLRFDNLAMLNNSDRETRFALSVRTVAAAKAIAKAFPALIRLSEHAQSTSDSYLKHQNPTIG